MQEARKQLGMKTSSRKPPLIICEKLRRQINEKSEGVHINYDSFSSNVVPFLEKAEFLLKILCFFESSSYPELSVSLGGYPNSSLKHFVK
jgi:hypothetical protein